MDEGEYPLTVVVDKIRDDHHRAGLLDTEEFDAVKDDVTDLAREIINEVDTSCGM